MQLMRRFFPLAFVLCIPFVACSGEDEPESREDFCGRWATATCNDDVVSVCQASDVDACRLSQERFCLDLVPVMGFVDTRADACIDAVKAAYADTNLDAKELDTVLRLGAPCDRLVRGPRSATQSCMSRADCDGPEGYDCVFKGGDAAGSCQKPIVVQPGRDCSAENAVCTEGFYCNGSNCIEGAGTGEACMRNEQCGEGFCGPNNLCSAGLSINASCTRDDECASGLCYSFSASERVCTDRVRLGRTDPLCENAR
jgi:hypothetical protein